MNGYLAVKNGKYYAVIKYKDLEDNTKQKWIATGLDEKGNKRKAEDMLRKELNNFEIKSKRESSPLEDLMFHEYLDLWLDNLRGNLQATTYNSYKLQVAQITKYFKPIQIKVADLRPFHLQKFYKDMQDLGKSIQVCEHFHVNIRKCLQSLVIGEIIPSNPADKIERPRSPKYNSKFYNYEQLKVLFEATERNRYDYIYKLTVAYGLRRSEVLGLRWNAINFHTNEILIEHTIVETKIDGKRIELAKDSTKNNSSYRSYPLLPFIKELLLNEKQRQNENKERYKNAYSKKFQEYICINDMGERLKAQYLSDNFHRIIKHTSLPRIRFHELRHSCASLLLAYKIPMKQIQEWLGHSTYETTANIYSHLDTTSKTETAKQVMKIFEDKITTDEDNEIARLEAELVALKAKKNKSFEM
ncbi:MAG: site-specific integrase [Christensenellaceae bacterium]|jgi:integrase|nr:site-specific integrase [Christensenellaceae bacterium]